MNIGSITYTSDLGGSDEPLNISMSGEHVYIITDSDLVFYVCYGVYNDIIRGMNDCFL